MTTPSTATEKKAATAAHPTGQIDAIALLTQDHADVKALFEQYDGLSDRSRASKKKVATQICLALTKHATAEEEIFYPAVREAVGDDDLIDEALVEHAAAKDLIAQILAMDPDDDLYDAKVKVLSEQIEHHVEEEEDELFPQARDAELDLMALGAAINGRKAQVELPVTQ